MPTYIHFKETSAFEIVLSSDDNKSYPTHLHESSYVIGLIRKGGITITTGNDTTAYKENECFIIPPFQAHSFTTADNYSALCLCLHIEVVHAFNHTAATKILNHLLQYIGEQLTASQFETIMLHLHLLFKTQYTSSKSDFTSVITYIKNNLTESSDLDVLSALSGYSKYHFERKFKKEIGLSPYDYQIQAKIKFSKYLLRQKLPITKVAADLGFTDQSHFNRYFKKHVGLTPKQYIHSLYEI